VGAMVSDAAPTPKNMLIELDETFDNDADLKK